MKLNIDGSCNLQSIQAGVGGLFRDHEGRWLMSFMQGLGACSSLDAKLWSILIGLRLGHRMGFDRLEVEIDFLMAIQAINGELKLFGNCCNQISSIQQLLK